MCRAVVFAKRPINPAIEGFSSKESLYTLENIVGKLFEIQSNSQTHDELQILRRKCHRIADSDASSTISFGAAVGQTSATSKSR